MTGSGDRPRSRGETGYVYVADEDEGPMSHARAGDVASVEGRGPPWIVVDEEIESVIVARWPGRLWRVMILDPATKADQDAHGGSPLPTARYTRCVAVSILAEENPAVLFGPHGEHLVRLLERAARLDRREAGRLGANRHRQAPAACDRVWRSWLRQEGVSHEGRERLDDTLMFGASTRGSPVNGGLSILHHVVFERARAVDGDAATQSDEEDSWLVEPWSGADAALRDAALALGAPEHVRDEDRAILLQGWSRAFG